MRGTLSGMGQGRIGVLLGVAATGAALAFSGSAGAAQSCGERVIADWRDGHISGSYPVSCYRQALADLPEDVRVYSSAQSDITRALQASVRAQAAKSKDTGHGSGGVSPLLVVVITAAILVAAGSVAAALR
jgi:hypothetical protein